MCQVLTKSCLDYINDGLACIDIGTNLTSSRSVFGSFFKNYDLRRLDIREVLLNTCFK